MSVLHWFWILPLFGIVGFLVILGLIAANRED